MRTLRSWLAAAGGIPAAVAGTSGTDDQAQGRFERIVISAIVVTYAAGMPVWSFGRVLAGPHRTSAAVAGGLAMACSVVLQLWLLAPAARARRPRHVGRLIAAFVVVNAAAFPLVGVLWFAAGEQLAVLAVVYLRPRWSVPAVVALISAPAATAISGYSPALGEYFAQNTAFWALTMGMLIWLGRATARLRASRQELVSSAVVAERVRIDDELGASLGAELEQLIAAGQRAAQAAGDDPATAERELRALTKASRGALTQTRRMVSRYQAITVRSELTTAAALLAAAGIPADVAVPSAALGQALDDERLAGFRSGLTTVLHDQTPGRCLITADGEDGDLRLAIRHLHQEPR
jgi:two-component system, NarL family, sensor histidine kinase DesK